MHVVRWKRPAAKDLGRIGKHIAADSTVNAAECREHVN
jgi:plasmid stabilization system protein ParE